MRAKYKTRNKEIVVTNQRKYKMYVVYIKYMEKHSTLVRNDSCKLVT